jgi:type IV secretion system protein TrbE
MSAVKHITRDFREAGAFHTLVGLHGFVGANADDPTFLTKSGDLGTVLKVEGVDAECLDHPQIDQIARRFEAALRMFDERYRVYQYLLKRDRAEIPHREYENPVVRQAIHRRVEYLAAQSDAIYSTEIYFVILYEGWHQSQNRVERFKAIARRPKQQIREMFSTGHRVDVLDADLERAREVLTNKVASFVIQVKDAVPVEVATKQMAFSFFRRLLNYAPHKAAAPLQYDEHLDYFACDSTLECHRDHLRLDDSYVQVLTLKEPPARTFAHLLAALHDIPSNAILVSEWQRESNLRIRKETHSKRRHFHNSKASLTNFVAGDNPNPQEMLIDDGAAALVTDLGGCLRELEINGNYFGRFSFTAILYGEDRAQVRRAAAECFKVFSTHDAVLIEERYNLLNAFLAVIPGNHAYNLRYLWLLNTNYADLSFLFAENAGEPVNAHLGAEYLAVLETGQSAPYFLNLHYQDIAHTIILGATGSGKSFFLNFLLTNMQKYQPLTYIFDLGGGYEHLTRLFEGSYLPVGIENRSFTINPFRLEPTKENLHFLYSFVRVLVESGGYQMTSHDERDLYDQVENLYAVDAEQRRLFTLRNILNRSLAQHLAKWCQGGQYGALFDNVEDNLTFARFQTFDFEGMDKYPQILEPLLFYILHRANAAIYDAAEATTFKAFVMDEAWRFFRNDTIKQYIIEAVKTWRKRNAAMILATQSSDDLHRSELMSIIVESCATKIFLANPGMDREAYRQTFHLNETETQKIANLLPKQQVLLKRPDRSKVLHLNVDPGSYWLYTNSPFDKKNPREVLERQGFERGLQQLAQERTKS